MRVAVLMSTYQGEAFVEAQVRSILDQLPADGWLSIRDDGSTDNTLERVRAIADPRIRISAGKNLGFAGSFLQLMSEVPPDIDAVFLADQDDVWLPGKLTRACEALRGAGDGPALYCSRLTLVDRDLVPFGDTPRWPRGPSFENALCENIVTGCTVALNRAALSLVLRTGDTRSIYFHDWWIYLVVSAFGRVIVDDTPTVLYRQHGHNVIGRGLGLDRYRAAIAFIRRRSWVHILFRQVENFRRVHGAALDPAKQQWMQRHFDPRSPASVMRLLLWPVRRRQFLADEFWLRGLVLFELTLGRGLLPRGDND